MADRLAQAGYRALVPDLYRGRLTVEAEEALHLMSGLNFGDAASQDIRGAVQQRRIRNPASYRSTDVELGHLLQGMALIKAG